MLTSVIYIVTYIVRYRNEFFVEPEIGFRILYGFVAMMIGSLIFDHKDSDKLKLRRKIWLLLGVVSCGGFLFIKLFINRVPILMHFQFMTQAFGVAFAMFMMLSGLGYEKEIQAFMGTRIGRAVELISSCSLEIYLVQFVIIMYLKEIIFPINLIAILLAIVGVAYIVNRLSHLAYRKIFRR